MNNDHSVNPIRAAVYVVGGLVLTAVFVTALNWVNANGLGTGDIAVLIIAGGAAGLSYSERSLPKDERRYQRLATGIVFGAVAALILNWINEVPIILQLFFVLIGALFGLRSQQNQ